MPSPPVARRVEILEEKVDALTQLPARVGAIETQLVALRTEVRTGFAGVREEFAAVREEMRAGDEETRRQMRILHEDLIARLALLQEGIDGSTGGRRQARPTNKRRR